MRKALFCYLILVLIYAEVIAQDRCGTVEYIKVLQNRNQVRETPEDFERWLKTKRIPRLPSQNGRTQATLQIPVVVHVIHNGEATGTGTNIPDAQILSQLSVLNKDYNRENADSGNTPTEFQSVAGALAVEFIMAKQDPEGLATTGIVRVKGSKSSWTMNDNYQLKAQSYWPAEDYLNIWVCRLTDFLGYSQFPVSALPGLENSSANRLTDGVVIAYNAFGSAEDGTFILQNAYNKGRTATHEIGHFLGLNHIWGDDDNACSGTDYVDDTPNQAGNTSGCPTHPQVTCTVTSMFQNYLDYTNDACMNLFTQGQVERMDIVMANSPRRASLTTSHGLNNPAPLANDLGIKDLLHPSTGECSTPFTPLIEVRNYGSNAITSARIRLRKDGAVTETKDFTFSPAIGPLESREITFSNLSFASGTHNAAFEILLTNGVADGQSANNTLSRTFDVPFSIAIPFIETLDALPTTWKILNPDLKLTWELQATGSTGNNALGINLYDYEDHVGEIDAFISPSFDLSTAPAALLKFEVAYAQFNSSSDGLKVLLLSNCNTNLDDGVVVYSKSGSALKTAPSTSDSFEPAADQWRTETVDLSGFTGQTNLQLAFVAINDWGNNLFIDNPRLTTEPIADVVASAIVQPSPVTCADGISPVVRVFNAGTLVTQLTVSITLNGTMTTKTFDDLHIPGNTSSDLTLPSVNLAEDQNELKIVLSDPNGVPDFLPFNNTITKRIIHNDQSDELPIRQRFDNNDSGNWTTVNPIAGMNWAPVSVGDDPALYVNAFANTTVGDQSWLVSPVLDFTDVPDGTLRYDHSYASRTGGTDLFYILASLDCGSSFTDTLYRAGPGALAKGRTSQSGWMPSSDSDWTANSIPLSRIAGAANVRIAFVFVNGHGNNLYVDNLEFFLSANPLKITDDLDVYPTLLQNEPLNTTFNLPEKDDVRIELIDVTGKTLNTWSVTGVLNQTFSFDLNYSAGMYYLRATTHSHVYVERFVIR